MSFHSFGLSEPVVHGVQRLGFIEPSPIQDAAIPPILAGRDVVGSAQTGTGKTAAFALPILSLLGERGSLRCLILEPTRELAAQVADAITDYAHFTQIRHTLLHGGVPYGPQRSDLRKGIDIVIATPGRLLDHMGQGALSLSGIQFLVLDEVDRMLDMGFLPDVKRIIEQCPVERQTLFFSATMPPEIERLTTWVLRDPVTIEIGRRRSPAETVNHALYPVAHQQKFELLLALLEDLSYHGCIIFSRTKAGADQIVARLEATQHRVTVLHSDRTQKQRFEALDGFKDGTFEVLVATDIAARGLDIQGVSHVINYDVPQHPEDYVHRIGRTGRAETAGDALTIMTGEDVEAVQAIERFVGRKIDRRKLDSFPYLYTALFDEAPPRPVLARRRRRR